MPSWNFADVWEAVAECLPTAPALLHGDLVRSWADFDARADCVAAALLNAGVTAGSSVAQYLSNRPEYLESVFAAFKLGLAPVNTNYRYVDDELVYLWDNADTSAVVFEGQFAERIEPLRAACRGVRLWLWVDDGIGPVPGLGDRRTSGAAAGPRPDPAPWGRSGDSLYLLYTGGTTGMPKGVMWRKDDLLLVLNDGAPRAPEAARAGRPRPRCARCARRRDPRAARLPAHARHRRVQRVHRPHGRRLRGDPHRPTLRRRSSCSTPSSTSR